MQHGVLVSGASTGIGRASVLELAGRGVRVFAGVRRSEDGEALRAEVGEHVVPVRLDVTDGAAIAAAVEEIAAANGDRALSGLVNNAGIVVAGPLEFLPVDAVRRSFEANVVGLLALTQACLPLLRSGRGRIVNMGSISGRFASPLLGPYAASKFAVEALSDALRRELAPWGIPVALIAPGAVATPIWEKSATAAQALLEGLPAEAHAYYGADIEHAQGRALRAARTGIPAAAVAVVVHEALTASRPRTRYLVGRDARIGAFLARWLPDRILDRYTRSTRSGTAGRDD
ncbi:MAG: SDR family NAD(P)-dependent oxidoreductase [Trueperaceae bacterium]|nr:SDR family NAD(P)-dependent oxidoreductase [Trueperaceae bacterium]